MSNFALKRSIILLISVKIVEMLMVELCNKRYSFYLKGILLYKNIRFSKSELLFWDKFIHHNVMFRGKELRHLLNPI